MLVFPLRMDNIYETYCYCDTNIYRVWSEYVDIVILRYAICVFFPGFEGCITVKLHHLMNLVFNLYYILFAFTYLSH